MSTAMNFGSKSFQPRPPDKGSFPLDHFGECKSFKEKFMKCLRDNNFENTLCRNESKEYLECRMERCVEGSLQTFGILREMGRLGARPSGAALWVPRFRRRHWLVRPRLVVRGVCF
ncbi:hypothetical protein FD755_005270 [Muntiacus reevesi]|uniref:Cytochrome c oxidase assembly protein COX19 n=2 Tax=Muntiacus TaxID=9885 RepID=A0A5J5MY60_MUNRE|nr:hypothetical protein FD754_016128 [Muntiacus muntjak]KAB0383353.1 hypothetical protein FD755_005270 [Muntiacus reevesi]